MKRDKKTLLFQIFKPYGIWLKAGVPAFVLAFVFYIICVPNVYTETYNLDKFSVADATIRSPITIENEKKTEQRVREATQAVDDQYTISSIIAEDRVNYVEEIFDAVEEVNQSSSSDGESLEIKSEKLTGLLSEEITEALPVGVFQPFLQATPSELRQVESLLMNLLPAFFEDGIRTTSIEGVEDQLTLKIRYGNVPDNLKQETIEVGKFSLVENAMFDTEGTSEARKKAATQVQPFMIQAGEVIVSEGATITSDIYEELKLTGLLNKQRNRFPLLGLAIFSLLIVTIFFHQAIQLLQTKRYSMRHIVVMLFVSVLMIGLMKVFSSFTTVNQPFYYILPAATGAILLKLLCNERVAIAMSIVYGMMASLLFNGDVAGMLNAHVAIYVVLSQFAAIFLLVHTKKRQSIVKAGAGAAVMNSLTILFVVFISFEKYSWYDLFLYAGYGIAGALLSVILTYGLLPFIDSGLGILTDSKLLTLSNPNHKLLRKILTEAPGTYHHSIMVANLSESACEAIGARGLLARVGAYYHDLGKTLNPHYFIENQMGMKNPHDFLKPEQSATIIINHPYDGAELLKKEKLPKEIIDIAKQHHGTTLLKYFYFQAKEEDEFASEMSFRYPGPKPQTKEAAIVCICDSVEAAVRSLDHPTTEEIKRIVHAIVEDRLLDGQFDECSLSFKELKTIENAICETLQGIFHSRIQYPDQHSIIKEAK